jgi:hypothetical protein
MFSWDVCVGLCTSMITIIIAIVNNLLVVMLVLVYVAIVSIFFILDYSDYGHALIIVYMFIYCVIVIICSI